MSKPDSPRTYSYGFGPLEIISLLLAVIGVALVILTVLGVITLG